MVLARRADAPHVSVFYYCESDINLSLNTCAFKGRPAFASLGTRKALGGMGTSNKPCAKLVWSAELPFRLLFVACCWFLASHDRGLVFGR